MIKFTHGDLHRSNVIVSRESPSHVVALVDWHQAGWLPEYWEDRKAHYTADPYSEWSTIHLPIILDQYEGTWNSWDFYTMATGN